MIKIAGKSDLKDVLSLYGILHPDEDYSNTGDFDSVWENIISDPKISCLIEFCDDRAVSTCTITVIPNITRNRRPYAVIENLVTDPAFRNMGYAKSVIQKAVEIARDNNCYKVMLLSGSERKDAHRFYEKIGFDGTAKRGFQLRLD